MYSLMSFGIPVGQLPISSGGTTKTKPLLKLLKAMKAKDDAQANKLKFNGIIHPNVQDVLFARGGAYRNHLGNREFAGLLESAIHKYNTPKSPTYLRIQLACQEILHVVFAMGGRILSLDQSGSWWVEITDPAEQENRVKTAWYDHVKRMNARAQQQTFSSESVSFAPLTQSVGAHNCGCSPW
jgi:hypothetical protein